MVPGKLRWCMETPQGTGGAINTRGCSFCDTRRQMPVAMAMSVFKAMAGPCCSLEPVGIRTISTPGNRSLTSVHERSSKISG
jgi:hypothetical protein